MTYLNERFPALKRIGIYSNASNVLAKTHDELVALEELGLGIAYLGLESGSDIILQKVKKPASADEQVRAVQMLSKAEIKTSVMVLLGLGGTELSEEHALRTAEIANQMQPRGTSKNLTPNP